MTLIKDEHTTNVNHDVDSGNTETFINVNSEETIEIDLLSD